MDSQVKPVAGFTRVQKARLFQAFPFKGLSLLRYYCARKITIKVGHSKLSSGRLIVYKMSLLVSVLSIANHYSKADLT